MRVLSNVLLGCLAVVGGAPAPVSAAVLIPVPAAPNSTSTTVFGISDGNVIAGSFIGANDGIEHSFFGSLDGNYSTFDVGTGGSEARAINNNGYIVGYSNSQGGFTSDEPAFERTPRGKILNVTIDGQQLFGPVHGINNSENKFVGTRWDQANHQAVAFSGRKGQWEHDVRIPAVHQASTAGGINSTDIVVGSFFEPPMHGYVVNGKTLSVIDYPSADNQGTSLEGINGKGKIVGQWIDSQSNTHSFLLDVATNTFTDIQVNGASTVQAWDINTAGAVAVSTDVGSFIWCARKRQCPAGGTNITAPVRTAKAFPHSRCDQVCAVPIMQVRAGSRE